MTEEVKIKKQETTQGSSEGPCRGPTHKCKYADYVYRKGGQIRVGCKAKGPGVQEVNPKSKRLIRYERPKDCRYWLIAKESLR